MQVVDFKKLRRYKKENKLNENRLHKKGYKIVKRISKHFGVKVHRERIFNPYIVDIYIEKIKVVIEIDGCVHNNKQSYDNKRDDYLFHQYGLRVYRFTPEDIKKGILKQVVWECCYTWLIYKIKRINDIAISANVSIPNSLLLE